MNWYLFTISFENLEKSKAFELEGEVLISFISFSWIPSSDRLSISDASGLCQHSSSLSGKVCPERYDLLLVADFDDLVRRIELLILDLLVANDLLGILRSMGSSCS